jgi:glycosyltransferase involved in cell wall biosynthesis
MLPNWLRPVVPALELWCQFIYRQAARIAVLSKGFKATLVSRGVPETKIQVIPNWCNDDVLTTPGSLEPAEEALLAGRFNIVMAGNMGVMQGLDVVLDAAVAVAGLEPRVQFVLVGSGLERAHLEQRAASLGLTNVLFLPKRPIQEIGALLSRAEALLVHLKDDPLFAITIPSRIQAYLAVGRPILCGVRGNAAELVLEAGAGICFESGDASSLVEAVKSLCGLPPEAQAEMGKRGRQFYQDRLSLPVGTRAFIELLDQARQS